MVTWDDKTQPQAAMPADPALAKTPAEAFPAAALAPAPLAARTLEDAISLAASAHRGQRDKVGAPYILHPLRLLFRLGPDATEHERMAAVLHDVVEDTPFKLEALAALGCPAEVLAAVECLTRRSDETYEQFIERLLPNAIARRVKRADLEDNMDILRLPTVGVKEADRLARYRAAWARVTARG